MADEAPGDLTTRRPTPEDHRRVLAVLDDWWGGFQREHGSARRRSLLPRLYFQHFADSSFLVERDGRLVAFLIGFVSQSRPDVGYIHFVGVDPAARRTGIAASLYRRFFQHVAARGCRQVTCITTPGNRLSVAFHTGIGFAISPGDTVIDGVSAHSDYDGPGLPCVVFTRALDDFLDPAPDPVGVDR
ncbi:GNAT family N-acetyltransferase [Frankia sp. CNm7]|uniref:GNAT family N-acetyltransferase n=1 Tax=Frankia nepalensis TaxID=1836974 RepID=A0A937UP70_9ACTN|nr:GNAT family N-acetyltransferase [Frankia nepalensis]MBL7499268.1 GNAT family N-acetyltransferase [Frankia nepalensis]MBL7513497.1 GNAT family N-acetyltransferase [Frankia nepalensis]MBL7517882.1 GNAT family N-acetyltransferase [Frankia nepalensis]MBL7628772.1 GNAT family N-acetyltransferase [Frankia nepalensis]